MDSLDKRPTLQNMDMRFGIWNIRSLYRTGSLTTASRELARYRLDVGGVQDVRSKCWNLSGSLKCEQIIHNDVNYLWTLPGYKNIDEISYEVDNSDVQCTTRRYFPVVSTTHNNCGTIRFYVSTRFTFGARYDMPVWTAVVERALPSTDELVNNPISR
jgi:hypothetical protein